MFQQEDHIARLITGHLKEELTTAQQAELEQWLAATPANREWFSQITTTQTIQDELSQFNQANTDASWNKLNQRINDQYPNTTTITTKNTTTKPTQLWKQLAIAAAIATLIFGAGLFYYKQYSQKQQTITTPKYANDVNPGKQGATLTLSSGKKIRISETNQGQIATETGITITKTKDGQIIYQTSEETNPNTANTNTNNNNIANATNTFETAKGETFQIKLPDGTHIWLNSSSSITYSANLIKDGKRNVTLKGEGYFQVTKDKAHPFVVTTNNQQVEVLGTEFNINSYTDEKATTTALIEGSVKVSSTTTSTATINKIKVIKPGELASTTGTDITISKANLDNITDWKNGEFNLEDADLRVVLRKIARWYDVEVIYDDNLPKTITSGGWISRTAKLSTILDGIEQSGLAHFRIAGKKIYVSK